MGSIWVVLYDKVPFRVLGPGGVRSFWTLLRLQRFEVLGLSLLNS